MDFEKRAIDAALKSFARTSLGRYGSPAILTMNTIKIWHDGYGYVQGHSYETIIDVLKEWQSKGWATIFNCPSDTTPNNSTIAEVTSYPGGF